MIIRDADTADAAEIAAIWNDFIQDTAITFTTELKSSDVIAAEIQARRDVGIRFIVAEREGHIAGFATAAQFRSGPGYAHTFEHTVMVRKGSEGLGIGRLLVHHIEQAVLAKGGHVLIAGTSGENPEAIAFHEALGFERVACMPEVGTKFGRWMDLVFLQKILTRGVLPD